MKFILLIVPFVLFGCCSNDRLLTAKAVEPLTNVILPEYEAYVRADPKLNETEAGITPELKAQRERTKKAALDSAEQLRRVIQRLKED